MTDNSIQEIGRGLNPVDQFGGQVFVGSAKSRVRDAHDDNGFDRAVIDELRRRLVGAPLGGSTGLLHEDILPIHEVEHRVAAIGCFIIRREPDDRISGDARLVLYELSRWSPVFFTGSPR